MSNNQRDIDNILIKKIKLGDKRAFDVLVLKYQSRLIKLISRYVQDPSDMLDISQEAFIKAYCALPNFRGDSAFYTWLYRIAINTAKNYSLFMGRRPPNTDIDIMDAEQQVGFLELQETATPEHCLLRDELQTAVVHAVDKLPTDLRIALTLRELEGYSYEEIALQMHCPIGTVRSRIFRARLAVDQHLRPLLRA